MEMQKYRVFVMLASGVVLNIDKEIITTRFEKDKKMDYPIFVLLTNLNLCGTHAKTFC